MSYLTKRNHFFPLRQKIYSCTFLPHSEPFISGTMYRPPTQDRQGSFTETITEHFSKNNANDAEMYILADFNIDLFSNQKYPYFIK